MNENLCPQKMAKYPIHIHVIPNLKLMPTSKGKDNILMYMVYVVVSNPGPHNPESSKEFLRIAPSSLSSSLHPSSLLYNHHHHHHHIIIVVVIIFITITIIIHVILILILIFIIIVIAIVIFIIISIINITILMINVGIIIIIII